MNYEKQLTEYMRWYQKQVTKLLNKHYSAISKTVGQTNFKYATQQTLWAANPAFAHKVTGQFTQMANDVYLKLRQGAYASWGLADDMNDALVKSYARGKDISPEQKGIYMARNIAALEAFMVRQGIGMGLSERVWNLSKQAKAQMETLLVHGLNEGTSASRLATQTKQYLKEPDKLFRRVRAKKGPQVGKLMLSKAAAAYHPGRGVYRSSYKNALRMTATEINMAYRMSDFNRRQNLNFVVGVRVFLSSAHPRQDICDEMAGDYSKGFVFTGWHPLCICQSESILASKSIAAKYIDGGEIPSKFQTQGIPPRARKFVKGNMSKINAAKNKPYWYKYNFTDGRLNKGIAPIRVAGSAVTVKVPMYKTPVQPPAPKPAIYPPLPKAPKKYSPKVGQPGIGTFGDLEGARYAQEQWVDSLTTLQKYAVKNYTETGSWRMNEGLRNGWDFLKKDGMSSEAIVAVKNKVKDCTLALKNAPKLKGVTYRGLQFENVAEGRRFLKKMEVGKVFTDKGFMSTSVLEKKAANFAAGGTTDYNFFLEVQGKNGRTVNIISEHGPEMEVLFSKGSRFEVTYVHDGPRYYHVKLKEI